MLFNSVVFLQFFGIFLFLYFLVRNNLQQRNLLILLASYVFYGWWDYRFLSLLLLSSFVDFIAGRKIEESSTHRRRKMFITLSVVTNLMILGFFKYFNFFAESFQSLAAQLGFTLTPWTLNIVLPVGISFYTFQSMSYSFDVYRGEIRASRNLVQFLAYVSFFPQLVAGPIERARDLLPQFNRTLSFTPTMLSTGVWLILWGMFKKVVIADNLAPLVDMAYTDEVRSCLLVVLGSIAFAFQIYCDFSGYTDIARGVAKILGFELRLNFNLPYAAVNIREFWRRWHISLSSWLRDYLYISLGGNRRGAARTQMNLLITMLLGGLWHGAAWNFVFWGLWHGLGLLIHRAWVEKQRRATKLKKACSWAGTMAFVLYGWLLFRAQSLDQIAAMTKALFLFENPTWLGHYALCLLLFTWPVILMQIWQYKKGDLLAPLSLPFWAKSLLQGALLYLLFVYWETDAKPFVYFQF